MAPDLFIGSGRRNGGCGGFHHTPDRRDPASGSSSSGGHPRRASPPVRLQSSDAAACVLRRRLQALLEGILVEALNVKTALFFLAFLPQFLVGGRSAAAQLVVMGIVCVALDTLVDVVAVLGSARWLQSRAPGRDRARLLGRASGVSLVGLGLYVAASRRGA